MKRRADSAFGLHFDFHASPAPGLVVGATLKEEDIRELCTLLHPDFIQIDCKGHPGWASYPTECENAMPEFATDTLALWRRVTREEGVALYLHYSGVIDHHYSKLHPADQVVNADGSLAEGVTRTCGFAYADKLLIPQLKELAGKYGADGVWVDGECWGTRVDFHPDTIAAFEAETGISLGGKLPVNREDPYYQEYHDFCRELFRRYVRHYVDAVHAEYPDFQIASNWAYTDHMPEAVTANVDFLSGDFNPWNSFNVARYAGRAIAQQNKTWDLMAWNFRAQNANKPGGVPKHPTQIMQEAATVLAVGGGFQNYITQYKDGSPRMEQIRRMKPVADFIRAREPYCFRDKVQHEAVILLSQYDRAHEDGMYGRAGYGRTVGLTSLFCDAGISVEIAGEYTLSGRLSDYKMIAIPELYYGLEDTMVAALLEYVQKGGSLLLTGVNTATFFQKHLPYTIDTDERSSQWRWVSLDHNEVGMLRDAHGVTAEGAETVVWYGDEERKTTIPGGVIFSYGKGKIAVLAADIGAQYGDCVQFIHRNILRALCGKLYTPTVTVEKAVGIVEMVETWKDGQFCIQLINGNGQHASTAAATEDQIPPVLDITLTMRCDKKPGAMVLQPTGKALDFTWKNGIATVVVDRVDIHEIVVVEM